MLSRIATFAALATMAIFADVSTARCEMQTLRIARQLGANYLSMMIVEHDQMIERVARERNLGSVKVVWSEFGNGAAMNDALLSGNLDIASGGLPPMFVLWDKTVNNMRVKGIAARSTVSGHLIVRNPNVRTLKDFTSNDRIAVPAVKVSMMAILLQMAVERDFGNGNYAALDPLTVSLPNPEALAIMQSGKGEITAHFTWAPFDSYLLRNPANRELLSSNDLFKEPLTTDVIWATSKFHDENPKLYSVFLEAFERATNFVNKDKTAAAKIYLEMTKDKASLKEIVDLLQTIEFTATPKNVYSVAEFMFRTGQLKNKPATWRDLFFPEIHAKNGS